MKTAHLGFSLIFLFFLSSCDRQIEGFVRGPERNPDGSTGTITGHQKEFVAGKQDVVTGGGYRVQATLGAPVGSIQGTSGGGYKLFHTVQGSISGN